MLVPSCISFVRGIENSPRCTKSVYPYPAWGPWRSVDGGTFKALANESHRWTLGTSTFPETRSSDADRAADNQNQKHHVNPVHFSVVSQFEFELPFRVGDRHGSVCYALSMPKRLSTKQYPADINQLAASLVEATTSEPLESTQQPTEKNPHAVALGRLGGKKGGPARAAKLSAKKRKEIARKAALVRWARKTQS